MENVKIVEKPEKHIFSDEMKAEIIKRDIEIEKNPDKGRDLFEFIEDIRKTL